MAGSLQNVAFLDGAKDSSTLETQYLSFPPHGAKTNTLETPDSMPFQSLLPFPSPCATYLMYSSPRRYDPHSTCYYLDQ